VRWSLPQTTALATVRGLDTMYVDLTRSSADLLRLRKQALASNDSTLNVSLILEDGSTYSETGKLALTEVAVDEATGSVTLRAIFPNPHQQLLPGMFVRARVNEGVMENAILAHNRASPATKGNATRWWSTLKTRSSSAASKRVTPTAINGWS
jgi:membrane fusion protein (multidrug efflux system)